MGRDGLIHDQAVASGIYTGIGKMSETIRSWMSAGLIDRNLGDPVTLAYALMTPIIQARIVWMHADAAPETANWPATSATATSSSSSPPPSPTSIDAP